MLKILLLEDEILDLFILKKLLSTEYDAQGFTTLPEALQWAATNTFDVVLIDYYLAPDLHADKALQEIQKIQGNSFKSFVLTNYVDEQQTKQLLQAGFHSIILKPLTLDKLKDVLYTGV